MLHKSLSRFFSCLLSDGLLVDKFIHALTDLSYTNKTKTINPHRHLRGSQSLMTFCGESYRSRSIVTQCATKRGGCKWTCLGYYTCQMPTNNLHATGPRRRSPAGPCQVWCKQSLIMEETYHWQLILFKIANCVHFKKIRGATVAFFILGHSYVT